MAALGYKEVRLFAGSGSKDLAQMIADYIDVPLSNWSIIDFPNENIWVRLNESVRGKDVYVILTHAKPVHRNIMEMLIAIDKSGACGRSVFRSRSARSATQRVRCFITPVRSASGINSLGDTQPRSG